MTNSFTLRDLPKEERPRERLVKFGEQALSVPTTIPPATPNRQKMIGK